MKALILAGGFATRLRPLSCSKPKLLFPVVGVPLIDIMAGWLKEGGVDEAILAVNHLSDRLRIEVGTGRMGLSMTLSVEEKPLGTAGPIRLAKDMLDDDQPFIVVNGDIVSDIDLKKMVEFHVDKAATATVSLASVPDPKPYGSVRIDPEGRVTGFEEKTKSAAKSTLINAGAYVLQPEIMNLIPDVGPVSMERMIFPSLAKGGKMWGCKHHGYWYDIGRINEYIRANRELLGIKQNLALKEPERGGGVVKQPSYVGRNTVLENGSKVGPNTILCENVSIKKGSLVRDSIIFEDTRIEEGCRVTGAVIGEKVVIGKRTRIREGSLIAGEIGVPAGSILSRNSIILT